MTADGMRILWLPIWFGDKVTTCLEIRNDKAFSPDTVYMVGGIVGVYRNFQNLLDYSERDSLTGLLNRKTFDDQLARMLQSAHARDPRLPGQPERRQHHAEEKQWLAVVDVDHFKTVNDKFGHLYGDEVLILIANLLQSSFRAQDRVFRFGGEEFVVLLRSTTLDNAWKIIERFRINVETHEFPQVGRVTVSVGFVSISAYESPVVTLGHADQALYYAKSNGRNRACHYDDLVAHGLLQTRVDLPFLGRLVAHDLVCAAEADAARQVHRFRLDVGLALRAVEHVHLGREQARFVRLDDDGQPARFQQHERPDRVDANTTHEFLRQRWIEMEFAPLVHLAQRLGRRDALVVAAVGRDGVVDVDDRGHLREFADLVFALAVRIPRAVAPLVVVQRDVERNGANLGRTAQDVVAVPRVAPHDVEFLVRQAARLVQDGVRHQRLARVVQQASDAGLVNRFRIHPARTAKRDQQRAHADRMQECVVVLGLDGGQPQQRGRIAQDRRRDVLDHGRHLVHFDRLAQARILHHGLDEAGGLAPDGHGTVEFLRQRRAQGRHRLRGDGRDLFLRRGLRFGHRGGIGHVQPARAVDRHGPDTRCDDLADLILGRQKETVAHERMLHPATIEVVDVHSNAQLSRSDFLEHEASRGCVLISPRSRVVQV
ncbi:hypothetical protein Lal_00015056 [Lupinus albus]|nr:hypothetical protein Lal_00015056 [Lupinus albus]